MSLEAIVLYLVRGYQNSICSTGICWRLCSRSMSQRQLRSWQTVLMRQCWRHSQNSGLSRGRRIRFWMNSDCMLCLAVQVPIGLCEELLEALFVVLKIYFYSFKWCVWYMSACGYVHVYRCPWRGIGSLQSWSDRQLRATDVDTGDLGEQFLMLFPCIFHVLGLFV